MLLSTFFPYSTLFRSCSRVDGFRSEGHGFGKVIGSSCGDQGCGCVEQHNVAAREFLSGEHLPDDLRVLSGITARNCLDGRSRQAELFRRNFIGAYLRIAYFGTSAGTADTDLVQSTV